MRKLVTFSLYFIFLSYWLHCHFCYRDIVVREVVWIGGVRCQVSKRIKSCGVEKARLRVREFHEDHQHQLQNISRMEATQVIMMGSWWLPGSVRRPPCCSLASIRALCWLVVAPRRSRIYTEILTSFTDSAQNDAWSWESYQGLIFTCWQIRHKAIWRGCCL